MSSVVDANVRGDHDHRKPAKENLLHIVIGGQAVLVRSSDIREVVRPGGLTAVPMGPEHLIGLANIHGQIVCIIDIGGVTTLPACQRTQTPRTRFLILRHPRMLVGIWADEVCSIRQMDAGMLPVAEASGDSVVQVEMGGELYALFECGCLFR